MSVQAHTKNFTFEGTWHSDRQPTPEQRHTVYLLNRHILQPLRDFMAEPITITDGFRQPGSGYGADKSEHFYGALAETDLEHYEGAADINIGKKPNAGRNLLAYNWLATNCRYSIGQLIWYVETTHLHISLAGPRHQAELLVCLSKKGDSYVRVSKASEITRHDKRLVGGV